MNQLGLLNIDIILKKEMFDLPLFIQDYEWLNQYSDGIFVDAFLYDKRIPLDNIDEIDISKDKVYIIEYRVYQNNFFVELYHNYIFLSFSRYQSIETNSLLALIMQKYAYFAEYIVAGFETDLFIDEYPFGLTKLINDESLYPVYVGMKSDNHLLFKCYGGYLPVNRLIEESLLDIFDKRLEIVG
ncbi:hypothetical protein LJC00_00815 [Dysgonomonas sp. OttesenSCG-928-M03]|nr:hypothetical protein [Dysgonomonas sp. OttesenSCG-928-M03]